MGGGGDEGGEEGEEGGEALNESCFCVCVWLGEVGCDE